jgi:hypothetical protein
MVMDLTIPKVNDIERTSLDSELTELEFTIALKI